ncbi:MAG: hypothetical protein V1834_04005 [Candidatus Micrarchaeota archaeon]
MQRSQLEPRKEPLNKEGAEEERIKSILSQCSNEELAKTHNSGAKSERNLNILRANMGAHPFKRAYTHAELAELHELAATRIQHILTAEKLRLLREKE